MSEQMNSFVRDCVAAVSPEKTALPAEFIAAAKAVGDKVEKWGCEHGIMTQKSLPRGGKFFAAIENFDIDHIDQGLGPQAVADLIADCGIAKCHEPAAAAKVAAVLFQTLGREGAIAFADYNSNDTETKGKVESLESLYGANLWQAVAPATEAFGINMDRVTPDLKTILTVALLQFHVSLTPRIVPIQSVTQSNVQITREKMDVYDMAKPDDDPTRVIDLYRDPDMVTTKAVRIEPLEANDAAGDFLVEDGIYKFCEDLNLFKLSIDGEKPGYEKTNHTDLIEDGIEVDNILVRLSTGEGDAAKSEEFLLKLPMHKARLVQVPDDRISTERRLQLDHTTVTLNAGTPVKGSTEESEILKDFTVASGKFLGIKLHLDAHVDRKTGEAAASAWGKLEVRSVAGAYEMSDDDKTFIAGCKIEFVGFTLDARYNEDNKRMTSIRAEINRRNMSYELPAGRNFVIDFAIGQEGAVNAAARLAQLEHIGRDGKIVKIIVDTLANVHDMRMTMGNNVKANAEIAEIYAAGDLVHQTAYSAPLDFGTGFLAWRSADAEGDIKEFVRIRLNKIVTGLLATSLMQQQLAEGKAPVFRMITSPYILGAVLSCRHIHAHLDSMDQRGNGAVEYTMTLSCGAKLEIVTSTFRKMNNRIVIIPYFEDAPTSVLNFGTDFDQGTLVGAITLGADNSAAHNRMFSTTREALIPTNVVGAFLEVTGLGDARIAMDFPGLVDAEELETAPDGD